MEGINICANILFLFLDGILSNDSFLPQLFVIALCARFLGGTKGVCEFVSCKDWRPRRYKERSKIVNILYSSLTKESIE